MDRKQVKYKQETSELDRISLRMALLVLVYLTTIVVVSFLLGRWLGKSNTIQLLMINNL